MADKPSATPRLGTRSVDALETVLFHAFHPRSALMNGKLPRLPTEGGAPPEPARRVQVMADDEIREKRDPAPRLPRQTEHYPQIVDHFLAVKNSKEIVGAMQAHFERLEKDHRELLGLAVEIEGDA